MNESPELKKIYGFIQTSLYMLAFLDFLVLFHTGNSEIGKFGVKTLNSISRMPFLKTPEIAKFCEIMIIIALGIGAKPKKNLQLNITKSIILPIILGLGFLFSSFIFIPYKNVEANNIIPFFNLYELSYLTFTLLGCLMTSVGVANISKILKIKVGKDKWNIDEESFDQQKEKIETETSINIPTKFYFEKRIRRGWININPFKGTLVIGTPGSGKSFGIISPTIRQMIKKDFALCLYDYKFPDLANIAYYNFLLKKTDENYKHQFKVINLDNVEYSKRVNPLRPEFLDTLPQSAETASAIVSSLQKGGGSSGGADQFFTQSAINFLTACIYFFAKYDNGRYSTLPHILCFLDRSYEEIFDTLFSNHELESILSTFRSAYDNKAFDQLEGQIGTLKIFLSRLNSKESAWVFSGDEVNLKISDRDEPSILVLASNPDTQDINSALFSAILNRLIRQINSKGNLPVGVVVDELPTIYIHNIDNLMATARSNKVAVMLGLQEIPQFKQFYKKEVADTITSIIGNIISGSVRDKYTLEWLERIFGKVKQKSQSMSINSNQTTVSINEKLDNLIPAGKIANLRTGEMVGIIAQDVSTDINEYVTSAINCKIDLDMAKIKKETDNLKIIKPYYSFLNKDGKDVKNDVLQENFQRIKKEIENIALTYSNKE